MFVLSPAGSLESYYSALNNGADEIYMGINAFNARVKAEEIDYISLKKAIADAHILGVKVYCTLNTLVFDDELEKVCATILQANNIGFDAFIVQDLAVVALVKEICPTAVLHFSTQMGIHNSYGALQAQKLGATRIVLSRECSLNDIRAIKQAVPNMEIEYFVQGALCVAFSGNCYLSNRLLGKSGNRGECAQLCRLPYLAKMDDNSFGRAYYLSTADLCLYKHLKELQEAGVDSLKIEGRLRRPSYVGKATQFYRKAVDYINANPTNIANLQKPKNALAEFGLQNKDLEELKTTFNRGNYLEDAYLKDDGNERIIYSKMQNHMGIKIGKVIKCEKFKNIHKITLQLSREVSQNDGLKIMRNGVEVASLGVGNVQTQGNNTIIFSKQSLRTDDDVYLIHSEKLEQKLKANKRQCPLEFEVSMKIGERVELKAFLPGHNISFVVKSDFVLEKAINSAVTAEDVQQSLSKVNDPIFCVTQINSTLDNVFIPKSALNALRREIVSQIRTYFAVEELKIDDYTKVIKAVENKLLGFGYLSSNTKQPPTTTLTLVRELDAKQNGLAYFPHDFLSNKTFDEVLQYLQSNNYNLYFFLPPFIQDMDLKLWHNMALEKLYNYKSRIIVLASNISHMQLATDFSVVAGDFCNITNHISAQMYASLGASGICLGYEIKNRDAVTSFCVDHKIRNNNILCFMSHCPFKAVTHTQCKDCKYTKSLTYTNDKGVKYGVERYRFARCYFYIFG